MEITHFGLEEWLNKWEKEAVYDLAQSSIEALTLEELIGLDGTTVTDFFQSLSKTSLDYGWSEGRQLSKRSRFFVSIAFFRKHYSNQWGDWGEPFGAVWID